jgi:hypothetical protein
MRGSNDNGAQVQDGKVGVAYIEELRFANYISRLQSKLDTTFDKHFKAYLKSAGINVSHQLFKIKLNDPQNFKDYKRAEVDEKLISNFNNLKDVKFISKRYLLQHYLGWSEDEVQVNEAMLKQELAIPEGGIAERLGELRMMYDDKWLEGRPDIKVAESYEDFTAETTKHDAGVNDDEKAPPPEDGEEKPDDAGADVGGDEAADKAEGGNDKEDKGAEGGEDKKDEKQSDAPSEEPRSLGSLDKDING